MASKDLMTAGAIAQALGAPPATVKKLIAAKGIAPAQKKGACSYYGADAVATLKKALADEKKAAKR